MAAAERGPDEVVIPAPPELDEVGTTLLRHRLRLVPPDRTVTVDGRDVLFCDERALRFIARTAGRHRAAGGSLRIRDPRPPLYQLLRLVGLHELIEETGPSGPAAGA